MRRLRTRFGVLEDSLDFIPPKDALERVSVLHQRNKARIVRRKKKQLRAKKVMISSEVSELA